jgi:hypothetical protein
MNPVVEWNHGSGHTLSFKRLDEDGDGHIDDIESIVLKVFGVPYLSAEDTRDLIGIHSVPLDDVLDKGQWEIDASGPSQFVVREELEVMTDGHTEAHSHYYSLKEKHPDQINEEAMYDVESSSETIRERVVGAALNPIDATFKGVHKVSKVSKAGVEKLAPISSMEEAELTLLGGQAGVATAVQLTSDVAVGAAWGLSDLSTTVAMGATEGAMGLTEAGKKIGVNVIANPMFAAAEATRTGVQSAAEYSSDVFVGTQASGQYGAKKTKQASKKGADVTLKVGKAGADLGVSVVKPVVGGVRDAADLTASVGGLQISAAKAAPGKAKAAAAASKEAAADVVGGARAGAKIAADGAKKTKGVTGKVAKASAGAAGKVTNPMLALAKDTAATGEAFKDAAKPVPTKVKKQSGGRGSFRRAAGAVRGKKKSTKPKGAPATENPMHQDHQSDSGSEEETEFGVD